MSLNSSVLFSVMVEGHQIDVVEQSDNDEIFFDLFENSTGECINPGQPLWVPLSEKFEKWPPKIQTMVIDFLAIEIGL